MTFVKLMPTEEEIFNWLKNVELFKGLKKNELKPLINSANYIELRSGEMLSYEGMSLSACPLVISGEIEAFRHTYLGDEKIFGIFHSYELVAIAALFMPHNRFPMAVRSKKDSAILLLDKNSLLQLFENDPILMKRLLTRFSVKLYEHVNHIDWLTSSSAEQRLAFYLLEQYKQQQVTKIIIPILRRQLATKLGIRYETLSRLLSSWRKQLWIEVNKEQITLLQIEPLNRLILPLQRSF